MLTPVLAYSKLTTLFTNTCLAGNCPNRDIEKSACFHLKSSLMLACISTEYKWMQTSTYVVQYEQFKRISCIYIEFYILAGTSKYGKQKSGHHGVLEILSHWLFGCVNSHAFCFFPPSLAYRSQSN